MEHWRNALERWRSAGLIDHATADRVAAFESSRKAPTDLEWPVLIALIFGGIALGAGILLLVASHWEAFRPTVRFVLVVALVVVLHIGGIVASDTPRFRSAFHVLGNIAFGAAIFLTGQIFHLTSEVAHGVLLWAIGTAASWWLLRDAPQTILLAILAPVAIGAEYGHYYFGSIWVTQAGAVWGCMMAITYLSALYPKRNTIDRHALMWVGGIGLIPAAFGSAAYWGNNPPVSHLLVAGAIAMIVAWLLRGALALVNFPFILWAILVSQLHEKPGNETSMLVYALFAIASGGLVWWGLRESRPERINFGIAGFALTVICFYISSVFDKVGRSESLIGLGILLLTGGWFLERWRRGLISGIREVK